MDIVKEVRQLDFFGGGGSHSHIFCIHTRKYYRLLIYQRSIDGAYGEEKT